MKLSSLALAVALCTPILFAKVGPASAAVDCTEIYQSVIGELTVATNDGEVAFATLDDAHGAAVREAMKEYGEAAERDFAGFKANCPDDRSVHTVQQRKRPR